MLSDGSLDTSITTTMLSRWHNYYVEGLRWLLEEVEIDGIYLDGIGYDRDVIQRVRKVMHQTRPGNLIDWQAFSAPIWSLRAIYGFDALHGQSLVR